MNRPEMLKVVPHAVIIANSCEDSVRKAIADGTIPSIRVGRNIRIPVHRWATALGCTAEDIWAALAESEAS